jgi:hypothetical protein
MDKVLGVGGEINRKRRMERSEHENILGRGMA